MWDWLVRQLILLFIHKLIRTKLTIKLRSYHFLSRLKLTFKVFKMKLFKYFKAVLLVSSLTTFVFVE